MGHNYLNIDLYQGVLKRISCLVVFSTFMQVLITPLDLALYFVLLPFLAISFFFVLTFKSLNRGITKYVLFYNSPFLVSMLISLPISYLYGDKAMRYEDINIVGRIVNLVIFSYTIIIIATFISVKQVDKRFVFKYYWLGCFVLLLTGIWQLEAYYLNIIPFPFETRSHVHSGGELAQSLSFRLTGLAQEPSYFVTYVIDFIFISYFLFKKKYKIIFVLLGLLILFLTFSPSGYILFVMCMTISFLLYILRYPTAKNLIRITILLVLSITLLYTVYCYVPESFEYFLFRLRTVEDSNRYDTIYRALLLVKESSVFNLLFGFGLKSLPLASNIINLGAETTNNLFVDLLFEGGIIGVVLLLTFYGCVFRVIWKNKDKTSFLLSNTLILSLLISSLFKAEYASLRTFVLLLMVYLLNFNAQTRSCHKKY